MRSLLMPVLSAFAVIPSIVLGFGADHRPGDLPVHDGWPAGIYDIVNQPNRVHGFWINGSDSLFYRGNPSELAKTINRLANVPGIEITVVLHVGPGNAKPPWATERVIPADWGINLSGKEAVTQVQDQIKVDVWLGENVSLNDLEIPASIKVQSAGEIDAFIQKRDALNAKP